MKLILITGNSYTSPKILNSCQHFPIRFHHFSFLMAFSSKFGNGNFSPVETISKGPPTFDIRKWESGSSENWVKEDVLYLFHSLSSLLLNYSTISWFYRLAFVWTAFRQAAHSTKRAENDWQVRVSWELRGKRKRTVRNSMERYLMMMIEIKRLPKVLFTELHNKNILLPQRGAVSAAYQKPIQNDYLRLSIFME